MPILKSPPKQAKNESLQLRLPAEFKHNLQRYAEFLDAPPSYIVVEAVNRILEKDHEFKAWLEQKRNTVHESQSEIEQSMETVKKS
jgi:predicted transcriptional regulator